MDIHESLKQILQKKEILGSVFYKNFFERCPEARSFFANVNMNEQAMVLTMTLMVIESHYSHDGPATTMYLQYLGHKHHTRKIPEDLYAPFGEALLASLEQVQGGEWNSALAQTWRAAIAEASRAVLVGYQQPLHV